MNENQRHGTLASSTPSPSSLIDDTANDQASVAQISPSPPPQSEGHRIGGLRITLMLLGVMIALPAFTMGANLSHALGVVGGIRASLLGGAILAAVALPAAIAGARSRRTSYELIQQAFGQTGGKVVNVVIVVAILGWFGVIAMMFGQAMLPMLLPVMPSVSTAWVAFAGCLLMTLVSAIGFRALDILSLLASPFKIAVLVWTAVVAMHRMSWHEVLRMQASHDFSVMTGISMVVGGLVGGAMLAPDITRFARTSTQAAIACVLGYGLFFPLVLTLAGIPSVAAGQTDLVVVMLALGLGLPAMLSVVLIAVTTNAFNLYASSLILVTTVPGRSRWKLSLIAAAIGTVAGLAGISERVIPYLIVMSISIPPIAGVYLTHHYLTCGWRVYRAPASPPAWRGAAFVAWGVGSGVAWAGHVSGWTMTGIAPLDALFASCALYVTYLVIRRYVGMRRSASQVPCENL
ncbi:MULTISPECIES: cytosine permease [Pandoraea]|uniref:cytosine permease n=1 Tax=Pandoraea TaxID=93217 RepID=UPI001F5D00D8|nr:MULTISPECIES: cytosine permease [Pandoraea]